MITLETGVPGAGKTLFCVSELLRRLVGAVVTHEDENGSKVDISRVIFTNINGLLLEHEKIGPGAPWTYDGKSDSWSQPEGGDKLGLNNWHQWAKPGSVIVYDEVQKPWPLAASGSKVPPCITALETHRHMGVDFIVLTQHPMLIHANLVRLVGRHLHIRRMGNMGLAIAYEWDSCSRTLLYKNAIAKSPYRYPKSVFKLYKSAELHTKQPRKMPSLIWGVFAGLAALAYFGPAAYGRITERINPAPVVVKAPDSKSVTTVVNYPPGQKPDIAQTVPAAAVGTTPIEPDIAGCGKVRSVCRCYDSNGKHVQKPLEFCASQVEPIGGLPAPVPRSIAELPDHTPTNSADDHALISWVNRDRLRPSY